MKKNAVGYAFISPWLIGFLVFTAGPIFASMYLSFTRYDIINKPVWIGIVNYKEMFFRDPLFWKSMSVTLTYAIVAVPIGVIAGLAIALILNMDLKGMAVYRTIFYLPSIVPVVATSMVFLWILNPQIGLVNQLLMRFGITGPSWFRDPKWALWSLVLMGMWGVGGSMIIYLAGLKDIPTHLYEAANIDGANAWQRTRHVTLPMMTPVIFFNLVMGIIGTFQYFTAAFIVSNGQGGPVDSTHFYALYLFNRAWRYYDMGYACAMAWVLFLLVVIITAGVFKTQAKWVHSGN